MNTLIQSRMVVSMLCSTWGLKFLTNYILQVTLDLLSVLLNILVLVKLVFEAKWILQLYISKAGQLHGWVKISVDGEINRATNQASLGGVIRDSQVS